MSLTVKICGLKTPETLKSAIDAGADWVGFVFFPKSPRHVSLDLATELGRYAGSHVKKVALVVDADDAALDDIAHALSLDMFQLHGHESPERVQAIKAKYGRPVMKALGIAEVADLEAARAYVASADLLLLDAKPPKNAVLPGGNGLPFDWHLLAGLDLENPFMVSGGLDPANVGEAIAISRPAGVDVSSGVETAPGVKDPEKIRAFVAAARQAERQL
jgi:phosphoribosylanthranilate isomerase